MSAGGVVAIVGGVLAVLGVVGLLGVIDREPVPGLLVGVILAGLTFVGVGVIADALEGEGWSSWLALGAPVAVLLVLAGWVALVRRVTR